MGYLNEFPHVKTWDSDLRQILEMFEDVKGLPKSWEEFSSTMSADWSELKEFVNSYFDDLDVQNEINNKIDALVNDGTIETIMQRLFDSYSQEVALLNARMDTFTSLPAGSTSGDAELADIRVDFTGKVWDNAGAAVRGVTSQLSSEIANVEESTIMEVFSGNDFNDLALRKQGVWAIGGTVTTNSPDSTFEGGWLLQSFPNLFSGGSYSLQIATDQNGRTFTRWVRTGNVSNVSEWHRIDAQDLTIAEEVNATTETDFNSMAFRQNGYYNLPPTKQLANSPDDTFTGGWLLNTRGPLFLNNRYALQVAVNQNGDTWARYVDLYNVNSVGAWNRVGAPVKNINWVAFGDSITAGQLRTNSYLDIASNIIGANFTNKGVGATGYIDTTGGNKCLYYVQNTDFANCDLCTIAYGINDYRINAPLGNENSVSNENSICGQLIASIEHIHTNYPKVKVVVLTPLNEIEVGSVSTNYAMETANTQGYTLRDLIEMIIKVCEKYNIPYIQMDKEIGWTRYNLATKLGDVVHPNENGYYDYGRTLGALMPFRK